MAHASSYQQAISEVEMTLNLAHRGARRVAPENTLPACEAAMAMGADGVEVDVQISADGHLFLLHDLTLEATTDGSGPATALTLAALRSLDAGSHFGPQWAGTKIPTLDELFDLLPATAFVNLELKRYSFATDGLEEAIVQFVRRRDVAGRVVLSSFNPTILWRLRQQALPLGLLYAPDLPVWLRHGQPRHFLHLDAVHPHHSQVRAPLPWLPVNTWTVNEPAEMRRLLRLGVNAIITDVPDVLAGVMRGGTDGGPP